MPEFRLSGTFNTLATTSIVLLTQIAKQPVVYQKNHQHKPLGVPQIQLFPSTSPSLPRIVTPIVIYDKLLFLVPSMLMQMK